MCVYVCVCVYIHLQMYALNPLSNYTSAHGFVLICFIRMCV